MNYAEYARRMRIARKIFQRNHRSLEGTLLSMAQTERKMAASLDLDSPSKLSHENRAFAYAEAAEMAGQIGSYVNNLEGQVESLTEWLEELEGAG